MSSPGDQLVAGGMSASGDAACWLLSAARIAVARGVSIASSAATAASRSVSCCRAMRPSNTVHSSSAIEGHRLDEFGIRGLAQQTHERRPGLSPPHQPERLGGGSSHSRVQVFEQTAKQAGDLRGAGHAAAGQCADLRIWIQQQCSRGLFWQDATQGGRGPDCLAPSGSGDHLLHDDPADGGDGVSPADRGKSFDRRGLLGDRMVEAKAPEAAAQRFQRRHRSGQLAPRRLGGKGPAVGQAGVGQVGYKRGVRQFRGEHGLAIGERRWRGRRVPEAGIREKVELHG